MSKLETMKGILSWVDRTDLMRVYGIGEEYSDLLQKAGVTTVAELARCDPSDLHERIRDLNVARRLVRRAPSRGTVAQWVEAAKALPWIVS